MALMGGYGAAFADNYPAKPIQLIVPYPPGGGTDVLARIVAQKMTEGWGRQVIVDNRPGGDTQIGTNAIARAAPDGYTFGLVTTTFAINKSLYPSLSYDSFRDFAPVTLIAETPMFLVANPKIEASTLTELVTLARQKPGQLNYSTPSSIGYVAGEMLKAMAGIDVVRVPYKGSAPSVLAVMSGEVSYTIDTLLATKAYVEAGRLRVIGVTSRQRSAELPSVPTISEAGLPGFDLTLWYGMLAPAGVPGEIVKKVAAEVGRVVALPDVKEKMQSLAATPRGSAPEDFASFLRAEIQKYEGVVAKQKLQVDG